jgi:crotonobetainyl-CoA:carnitine CoA-transferase CaiB-like acyl-CoA transferase
MVYECKDGHISTLIAGGTTVGNSTKALIEWMREKGFGSEWMRTKDWVSWVPGVFMKLTEQDHFEINDLETTIQRFMLTMTKHEIYTQGLKRRIFLAPVANVADVASDEQLKARDFWTAVPHDTIGRTLTFPGPFAKLSTTPIGTTTRAPRVGEHNNEIYCGLLGFTPERLNKLRAAGSI